jgi:heat-inducible transcriptional repressor
MRIQGASDDALNPRQQQVLTAIVDHYIVKAEPVSSKILSLSPVFHASSATLRNTMAELTDLGYVEQSHSSSGRRPTDRGYRTYVDELMQPAELDLADRKTLEAGLAGIVDEQELLNQTALLLGRMTQLVGVAVSPSVEQGTFRHLTLHALEQGRILVVLHASDMVIRTVLSDEALDTSFFRLDSLAHRLNAEMQGRPVADLNQHLSQIPDRPISPEENRAMQFLKRSIVKLIDSEKQQELQVSGAHNLLRSRDFEKMEDIESLLEMVESKIALVHFLRNHAERNGVHVTIGQEQRDGKPFRSLSIVTEAYSRGGSHGLVGVMGPKRLPYSRLVALVHHAAQTLNQNLSPDKGEN